MTADTSKADHDKSTKGAYQKVNGVIFQDGVMGTLSRAGQCYFYTLAALNDAAAYVATEQTSANMEAARTLAQCHDFGEAVQVQSRLLKSSGEAYMRGWSRWIEASNQYMSDTFR